MNDVLLQETFYSRYPSGHTHKLMIEAYRGHTNNCGLKGLPSHSNSSTRNTFDRVATSEEANAHMLLDRVTTDTVRIKISI
jgi:hypothetical protein